MRLKSENYLNRMNEEEREEVIRIVKNEGFDYGICYYTNFKDEVKDITFHQYRDKYLEAKKNLLKYIGLDKMDF